MTFKLSVILPAHNPRGDYLLEVLNALRRQTLPPSQWELVVVDNGSAPPLQGHVDLEWHPGATVLREERLGLTHARLAGFARASGELILLVDDDNALSADYLEQALQISTDFPFVAVWGGAIRPRFEDAGTVLPANLHSLLTLREVPADLWSNDPDHHASTPWGAGLCLRREVAERYAAEIAANPGRYDLDLHGTVLLYGGDTDIAYTACRMGRAKGVFRNLTLTHLISRSRCTEEHLCRVAYGRGYSEILHYVVLNKGLPLQTASFSHWARTQFRRWRLPALERAVDRAHARGRADASRDLARAADQSAIRK